MRRAALFASFLFLVVVAPAWASTEGFGDARETFLVVVEEPRSSWVERIEFAGGSVLGFVPPSGYLIRMMPREAGVFSGSPGVHSLELLASTSKLSPSLPQEGRVNVTLLVTLDEDLAGVLAKVRVAGGQPIASATTDLEHVLDVEVDAKQFAALAFLPGVFWIEPAGDDAGLDNANASAAVQSGGAGEWPLHARGINGSTQVVAVCDTGINTDVFGLANPRPVPALLRTVHETMADDSTYIEYGAAFSPAPLALSAHRKIHSYYSPQEEGNRGDADDANGHGNHIAGTIAGDAPPYGERGDSDGVAFAARLVICDASVGQSFQILNDYSRYWQPAYDVGARIHSNSWGTTPTADYTIKARQHDAYAWTHRDFLILRAMGNAGPEGVMRGEAAAKSVLAVGALSNRGDFGELADFTSPGPTSDGRIKPDLIAPGDCVRSADLPGPTSYACAGGTSQATAVAAGAAALVRDHFSKVEGRNVSSALVRAIMKVSGREVPLDRDTGGFPNNAQGWGRIVLADVLHAPAANRGVVALDEDAALDTGSSWSTEVVVADVRPLKVMLSWTDAPALAGASVALVNDLDLRVVGPDGSVWIGNGVITGGSPDRRNVDESVALDAVAPGTYRIEVVGAQVPLGPQPFALVVVMGE